MRRIILLAGSVVLFGAALLAERPVAGWASQAAPTATAVEGDDADVSGRELLLQATLGEVPEPPVLLRLTRTTLEPGASSTTLVSPGPEFGLVETGNLIILVGGDAVVLPAGGAAGTESRRIPTGGGAELATGDRVAYLADTPRTYRNAGRQPASLLTVTILPASGAEPTVLPGPDGTPLPEDVSVADSRVLGEAEVEALPAGRSALTIERFTLSDGDGIVAYPGPVLVAIEEGAFSSSLNQGEVRVFRGDDPGAGADATQGATFSVGAGDALFFPDGMAETPPLEGEGRLILLRVGILGVGEASATGAAEATAEPTAEVTVEATAAETATAATIEEGTTVVVIEDGVNLRAGPATDAEIAAELPSGYVLVVTGEAVAGDGLTWYPVQDPIDGQEGFIAADLVAPEE